MGGWYKVADNNYTFKCSCCGHVRVWWNGKSSANNQFTCTLCQSKKQIDLINKIINMASGNNMQSLRDKLFECIDDLKAKKISIGEVREICHVAQTIVNTVKVEVDYIHAIGAKKPGSFMDIGIGEDVEEKTIKQRILPGYKETKDDEDESEYELQRFRDKEDEIKRNAAEIIPLPAKSF